jgi:acyl-CoA dehydrogenase
MKNTLAAVLAEYHDANGQGDADGLASFGFAIRVNNLKLTSSQLVVDIVGKAMIICGISGYKNDSKLSLCRQLRDAYGAALMVNNDRILGQNATMQIVQREG